MTGFRAMPICPGAVPTFVVLPIPSCPLALSPQQMICPVHVRAHVKYPPAAIVQAGMLRTESADRWGHRYLHLVAILVIYIAIYLRG